MNKDIQDKTDINIRNLHDNSSGGHCGYCHNKKNGGSKTWGLSSFKTRVDDYEEMINRGWRRCGTYYYKTDLQNSCCQLYTIRLKVSEFQISQKQRKALNKFNRFLNGELDSKDKAELEEAKHPVKAKSETLAKYGKLINDIVIKGVDEVVKNDKKGISELLTLDKIVEKIQTSKPKDSTHGDLATNAALILFNTNKKLLQTKKPTSLGDIQNAIIERIGPLCNEQKFKISPAQNGFINFIAEFDLKTMVAQEIESLNPKPKEKHTKPQKSEKVIGKAGKEEKEEKKEKEEVKKALQQYTNYFKELVPNTNPNPVHKYTIDIVPAIATNESFEVFKLYQEHIHKEPGKKMSQFKNFLCDSPLYDPNNPDDVKRLIPINDSGKKFENQGIWPKYLGSYHMYHRIDGKLIAVGVLDFTPKLASSVYFFYDPAYKFLNMGIVGALREIEYVRNIQEKYSPGFEFYCLGYYIQDCVKSVYKGTYNPSYLLCPETYTWVLLDNVRKLIAEKGYSRLAEKGVDLIDDMKFTKEEILNFMKSSSIITENDSIPFLMLVKEFSNLIQIIIRKLGKGLLKNLVWTA